MDLDYGKRSSIYLSLCSLTNLFTMFFLIYVLFEFDPSQYCCLGSGVCWSLVEIEILVIMLLSVSHVGHPNDPV